MKNISWIKVSTVKGKNPRKKIQNITYLLDKSAINIRAEKRCEDAEINDLHQNSQWNKHFRKLFHLAKTSKELHYAKSYLYRYFARGKVGVYKWNPKNQIFEHYNKKDACESFIQVNPYQPLIYREPNGAYYINKFPGFLHTFSIPFNQFSKEIRDAVKLILNHMRKVLCSSNKDQELYMMGLTLRIAIVTGKTMLTWFLRIMVLGPKISTKTSNEKIITGSFNKELEALNMILTKLSLNVASVSSPRITISKSVVSPTSLGIK
ncbi:8607_t:CDS:2 [Diversispora eburnea]|uniref:8607_t:CDS:1 n=1 Tax=Diversispora eburnea TaxID=1213867 RepID=A0A9N8W7G8_9GLOM|nr:8607_t:CDS:2 [Diversispora eburnea]